MSSSAVRWVIALPAEARAIRNKYGMESAGTQDGFKFFKSKDGVHWLVVSGVGQQRCASAVDALAAFSKAPPWAVWLNVGICGHGTQPIGSILLAHKLIEQSTGAVSYPGLACGAVCTTSTVVTVDEVEQNYPDDVAYDMEATAFFQAAKKQTALELVAILKCVSDNPDSSVERISRDHVVTWVTDGLPQIERVLTSMLGLSAIEAGRVESPAHLDVLLDSWRFSVSLQHQLRSALRRWSALCPEADPLDVVHGCRNGREVIARLVAHLDELPVDWARR